MSKGPLQESGEHRAVGPVDPASDPELLFDHLYENYEPMVERWVHRLAGPSAEAEDMIHDVFVVALRRRKEFRGEAKVSTWLFRITEYVMRKRRFRWRLRRWLDVLHRSHAEALAPQAPTPLEVLEERQRRARLYKALDRLPDKYRMVIILFDLEGARAEEVGHVLGLSANAVWVRVHRARALLLEQLTTREGRPEV